MKIISESRDRTIEIGYRLGRLLKRGDLIALIGELGSGKTVFTKGIARGLRVSNVRYVNSPSFVIVKEYKGKIPLYHFDIFRLDRPELLHSVGYNDYFYGDGVTVIEWAEKIKSLLPEEYLRIKFSFRGEDTRVIDIRGRGRHFEDVVKRLRGQVSDGHQGRSPVSKKWY